VTRTATSRVVVVTRPTEYAALVARHGTRDQTRFFLEQRGRSIEPVDERHELQTAAVTAVSAAIPVEWRRARVLRSDLDRFLFEPIDIIVTVGQSGLVANVAKYLSGQPVIGVSPDPGRDGAVLARHSAAEAGVLMRAAASGSAAVHERTMVEAQLDDGQRVLALNEVFIGHVSHQSARYLIRRAESSEHQSSSGIVVTTGTGATGWGASISLERGAALDLAPEDPRLCFFVREAWPSPTFGTSLTAGMIEADQALEIVSELDEGGVLFGDGIESDRLAFRWGVQATIRVAPERLRLVQGSGTD
jgi:NAD kinase